MSVAQECFHAGVCVRGCRSLLAISGEGGVTAGKEPYRYFRSRGIGTGT